MIRQLVESDLDAFFWVRSISYPGVELEESEYRRILASRPPYTRGLFLEDELACVATMWPFEMNVAGVVVAMGGLAGVASAPEHRRGGLVRELLLAELALLYENGVGWSLEFPFDPCFYHRLGWQSLPSGNELELPSERLFRGGPPRRARRLPLSEFGSLAPVYDTWAKRYNFTLDRSDDPRESWSRIAAKPWLDEDAFLYAFDEAYVLFTLARENDRVVLAVEDYAYTSAAGHRDIMSFLGSMHGQAAAVRIKLPDDDPITLDHQPRFVRPRRWPMQVRVVDLAAALAPLRGPSGESYKLRVHDDNCPWNHGTFAVRFGETGTTVEASSGAADAELPIQTVPLLIFGVVGPAAALAHGQAEGEPAALTALASLGGGRTSFMPLSDAF
jgi:predicted acetyltransferase